MVAQLRQCVPQWSIDGPDNIWILKPGGKSRGRGIHCFNSLHKLRTQARSLFSAFSTACVHVCLVRSGSLRCCAFLMRCTGIG